MENVQFLVSGGKLKVEIFLPEIAILKSVEATGVDAWSL